MKIQEEPVDEVTEALKAFFERKGGHQAVARAIDVNAQQLYYIISGRNAPTLKTVMRILRAYPNEVDLRRALSLNGMIEAPKDSGPDRDPTPAAPVALSPQEVELVIAKKENEGLKNLLDEKDEQIRNLKESLAHSRDIIAYQHLQMERENGNRGNRSEEALLPQVGKLAAGRYATGSESRVGFEQGYMTQESNVTDTLISESVFSAIWTNRAFFSSDSDFPYQSTSQAQA